MYREQLYELLHRQPFQPFRIHLKDDRVYEIRFPRINLLGQHHLTVGIPVPNDPDPVYKSQVLVLFSWITRIEVLPTSTPSAAS